MISFLRGVVAEKSPAGVSLDVHGVGYFVYVSAEAFGALSTGSESHLIIYEHIKEDAHDLYGFLTQPAKELFQQLISVNGVGPKMGLNIMNIGTADQLKLAIANGDTKYIQSASGVGKRLAERLIVDLKDKVGLVSSDQATSFLGAPSSLDEAAQALTALGYSEQDAVMALANIDSNLSTEERIKLALRSGAN